MKRFVLVFLILSLSSCKKDEKDPKLVTQEKRDTILNIVMYSENNKTESSWKVVENEFEALNPKVDLIPQVLFGEEYHAKFLEYAKEGTMPELMYLWPGSRTKIVAEKGYIKDLTPFIKRDGIDKLIKPSALAYQGDNGEIWEIPITTSSTSVLFVKKSRLQGYSINSLDDLKKFAQNTGVAPIVVAARDAWVMNSVLFSMILGRIAGPNWISKASKGFYRFTDKLFVESLYVLKDLYDSNVISKDNLNLIYDDRMKYFKNSPSPILIDGEWSTFELPFDKNDPDVDMVVFPSIKGEIANSTSIVAGVGFGMKAGMSENESEAAWSFIKYYISAESQRNRLVLNGIVPSAKDVDVSSVNIDLFTKKRIEFSKRYSALDVIDNFLTGRVNEVLNSGLKEMVLGVKTPERLAVDIQNAFNYSDDTK